MRRTGTDSEDSSEWLLKATLTTGGLFLVMWFCVLGIKLNRNRNLRDEEIASGEANPSPQASPRTLTKNLLPPDRRPHGGTGSPSAGGGLSGFGIAEGEDMATYLPSNATDIDEESIRGADEDDSAPLVVSNTSSNDQKQKKHPRNLVPAVE